MSLGKVWTEMTKWAGGSMEVVSEEQMRSSGRPKRRGCGSEGHSASPPLRGWLGEEPQPGQK